MLFRSIKPEKLNDEKFKNVRSRSIGSSINSGPHYYFAISSVDYFLNELKEAQKTYPADLKKLHAESETRKNWGGDILGWLFPIILMIGLWIFIMRKMSGGAGGGAGGIFSIGKSKAALFDSKKQINITFKDIAALDEAKEEVMEIVEFLQQIGRASCRERV